MRMWVLVSLFATAALTSGCKKKSECVRRVERYLACDEAKPNPERACREMPEEAKNEMDGPVFKITDDPRITRLGRFIRKTSIDELPQFWNVFIGEMSLVGPRPPIPAEVEKYERWQRRRLSMKPGITCIWQVSGRNNVDFKTWMQHLALHLWHPPWE